MKILNIYITKNLLSILLAAVIVLTVGMLGGNLLQLMNLIARGIPVSIALKALYYMLPMMFSFTIPMAILVSVLLMFGKMSADNEITAMKACGISIFQIISPLIVLSFILAALCLALQTYWSPYYWRKGDILTRYIGLTNPEALIQPGQPSNFDNMVVYVKAKDKEGNIRDVQIFTFDKSRKNITQDITGVSGKISSNKELGLLYITLYNYNIINYDHSSSEDRLYGKEFILSINIAKEINDEPLQNKIRFMTFDDLIGKITLYKKLGFPTTEMETQLNLMFAMGLSPIAFLLLGFPLAIRTSRRETSIGLFISVVLAGFFFFFMILCNTLTEQPHLYPQYLLWIPNITYQIGGLYFLYKITKR